MRADRRTPLLALLLIAPAPAMAQSFTLTQDGAPTAPAWERPALVAATIDRRGRDHVEVHANADMQFDFDVSASRAARTRTVAIGPNISWDRSTREEDEQDALTAGLVVHLTDEPDLPSIRQGSTPLFLAAQINLDFARTAVFPDRNGAACTAGTQTCRIRHQQSLRGKVAVLP